jgi:hypothetical protein
MMDQQIALRLGADLFLLHAPSVYDFRERDDMLFAYLSDSINLSASPNPRSTRQAELADDRGNVHVPALSKGRECLHPLITYDRRTGIDDPNTT